MSGGPVIDIPRFFRDVTGVTKAEKDAKKAQNRVRARLTGGASEENQVDPIDEFRVRLQRARRSRTSGRQGTRLAGQQVTGTVLGNANPQQPTLLGL